MEKTQNGQIVMFTYQHQKNRCEDFFLVDNLRRKRNLLLRKELDHLKLM
jgi:hypothetical protein